MYYMDSMVPSCTNDKSCICTTWIKWCRPVQTTRAVYVLHGFNGAVLYKRQEQYKYYMDSMVPHHLIHVVLIQLLSFVQDGTIESMWYIYSSCRLYRTAPLNPCSTYTALVVCTGRHHWIHVVHIQLLLFEQTKRAVYVTHGFNGADLYKR
jgi:hypothetical protein